MKKESNWKKTFFTIWAGQAFSQLSSSVLQMAIVWDLIANTNSSIILALSGIMAFLPQGLLGPFIGVFIDRYDRKKIMIVSDLVIALASLSLVVAGIFGPMPIWLVMIVLCIRSIGTAFHTPSLQAVTPLIVPNNMLAKCSGYSQTLQSVSLIISPALAAALYAILDINYIVLIDVIGALIALITLAVSKIPKLDNVEKSEVLNVIIEAKDGIKALRRHNLLTFMIICALFSLVYMPIYVLYPMMTLSYFCKTSWHAGLVEIIFGIGMLVGAVTLGSWGGFKNKIYTIMLSTLLIGFGLLFSGLLPLSGFIWFAVLSSIIGFASPFYTGIQTVIFQDKVEPKYLGRVMSLVGSLMVISTPIGIFISGFISEQIGINSLFTLLGIIIVIISLLFIAIPSVRDVEKYE